QPMVYGDFGDLVAAYDRLEHMSAGVFVGGVRASGEAYNAMVFSRPPNDPRSPGERVGFVLTRHADGWAIRSVYDAPQDLPPQRNEGTPMCAFILKMFLDSDPQRAVQHRNEWSAQHPDSTGR